MTVAAVRAFADAVGQDLDAWLAALFFTRHISSSGKPDRLAAPEPPRDLRREDEGQEGEGRDEDPPAFACLVYYHKLDADLLPKLRTQHVGPLRARFETELRTLDAITSPTATRPRPRSTWPTPSTNSRSSTLASNRSPPASSSKGSNPPRR